MANFIDEAIPRNTTIQFAPPSYANFYAFQQSHIARHHKHGGIARVVSRHWNIDGSVWYAVECEHKRRFSVEDKQIVRS